MMVHVPRIHPGEMLREEYMPPVGLTVETRAERMGLSVEHIEGIIAEGAGIKAAVAPLGGAFGRRPSSGRTSSRLSTAAPVGRTDDQHASAQFSSSRAGGSPRIACWRSSTHALRLAEEVEMRVCIIGAVSCMLAQATAAAPASLPAYDIEAFCRKMIYSTSPAECVEEERKAHASLALGLAKIPATSVEYCDQVAQAVGGSYLILDGCIANELELIAAGQLTVDGSGRRLYVPMPE